MATAGVPGGTGGSPPLGRIVLAVVAVGFVALIWLHFLQPRDQDNSTQNSAPNAVPGSTTQEPPSIPGSTSKAGRATEPTLVRETDAELPQARIDGTVKSGDRAIAGALVELLTGELGIHEALIIAIKTDVNGRFIIASINKGRYRIRVLAPGYLPEILDVAFDGTNTLFRNLTLTKSSPRLGRSYETEAANEQIFYATDREPAKESDPARFYANDRSSNSQLFFGQCTVTVPKGAKPTGAAESSQSRRFGSDSSFGVIVQDVRPESAENFVKDLNAKGNGTEALVYIHGFANSFEDAAQVAASLKRSLQFDDRPVIFYSWPSNDNYLAYSADANNEDWSARGHFSDFLQKLMSSGVKRIHFIAHSMGNRILLNEIDKYSNHEFPPLFGKLIFAAPDEDADTFKMIINRMQVAPHHLTLYASSKDVALLFSKWANSFRVPPYRRAGDEKEGILLRQLDSIDATKVDTSFPYHSYYVSSDRVEEDICRVLLNQEPPRPHLQTKGQSGYWVLLQKDDQSGVDRERACDPKP